MSYNASPAGTGSGGKSAGGYQPSTGGYQPTQQAQQQFAGGVAQQQPGTADQLNQIAGVGSPAVSTMVNQQMAPQGATGLPPVMGMSSQSAPNPLAGVNSAAQNMFNQYGSALGMNATAPIYGGGLGPSGDQSQPIQGMGANPIGLPNGQQLDLSSPQQQQIAAQNSFFNNTIAPTYGQALQGSTNLYNQSAPGITPEQQAQITAQNNFFTGTNPPVTTAAQNLAKPAPAPMPTKAAQGYVSRVAPRTAAAPAPVKQPIKLNTAPKRVK
jgi:hypothetical protein